MTAKLQIGIVGASGIGKHHGKWYAMEGCEVAAFVGTSAASVARAQDAMAQIFDFRGAGYTSLEQMLAQHRLQAASVCSPHRLHREHTLACLAAGAHVLCEKPMVWDEAKPAAEMLADAREMISAAQSARRTLTFNLQYAAAVEPYRELHEKHRGALGDIERLDFRMESKGGVSGPNQYDEIWIDLASHPLSLLLRFVPDARLAAESASCVIRRDEVIAEFEVEDARGKRAAARIELRNVREGAMVRRFGINGFTADVAGGNDQHGIYRTYLTAEDSRVQCEDLVHTSVRRFVESLRGVGAPLVTPQEAYRNLELQLALYALARREE